MKRKRKQNNFIIILLSLIFLVVCAALTVSYVKLSREAEENARILSENRKEMEEYEILLAAVEGDASLLIERNKELSTEIEELTSTIERLKDEKTAESEILTQYKKKIEEQQSLLSDKQLSIEEKEELLEDYSKTILESERLIAEKETLIADTQKKLEETKKVFENNLKELDETYSLLAKFQKLVNSNHGYHSGKISELYRLLENTPIKPPSFWDDDDDPAETEPYVEENAVVSYYYCDLSTGYTIAHNETEAKYAASVIKAPYVYSVLREIEEFERNKREFSADGTPLYDEEGKPLFEGAHPNLTEDGRIIYLPGEEKYDLSREWIYDPATMYQEGSGEIKRMEKGTKLTYRNLVEYTLLYSDNIAFSELRKVFGYTVYYEKAAELGCTGYNYGFMQLTAEDCGKFMCAIYDFFGTESELALMMKDCMIRSLHTVMIVNALYGIPVAHKYGWDQGAYHDMGIVYDDNPYVLVIMTDLENGGTDANAYIAKIAQLTHQIHTSHS